MTQPVQSQDTIVEEVSVVIVPADNTGSGHGNGAGAVFQNGVVTALKAQVGALGSQIEALLYLTELLDNSAAYRSVLDTLAAEVAKLGQIRPVLL